MAKSLVDYIFRWLGMEFIEGFRETHLARSGHGASTAAAPRPARRPETGVEIVREDADDADDESNGNGNGNGNGHGHGRGHAAASDAGQSGTAPERSAADAGTATSSPRGMVDRSLMDLMGDAPACDACGAITVRNGTCYKCLNCGNSMGCS